MIGKEELNSQVRMEQIAVFEEKVVLTPKDLQGEITSFDDILVQKLKDQLEGRCSRHGYVKKESVEILSRSLGYAEKGRFTADILYYIKAQGKVLNPPDGFEVEGEVIRKNKMGLYVVIDDAIKIMIPRDLHIGNEEFDSIEMGDKIRIEIKKSRFQVNDSYILSVGKFVGRVGAEVAPVPQPAEEEKEEETMEDSLGTDEEEDAEEEEEKKEEEEENEDDEV